MNLQHKEIWEKQLANLEDTVAFQRQLIKGLETQVDEKDAKIDELRTMVSEKQNLV